MSYILYCDLLFTQEGQTPLLLAVRNNNIAIVRELVAARVDVDYMQEVRALFPHLLNIFQYSCIEFVCDNVCIYTYIIQGGLSALMLCCEEGNSEMADLLLNSPANPNLQQSVCIHYS